MFDVAGPERFLHRGECFSPLNGNRMVADPGRSEGNRRETLYSTTAEHESATRQVRQAHLHCRGHSPRIPKVGSVIGSEYLPCETNDFVKGQVLICGYGSPTPTPLHDSPSPGTSTFESDTDGDGSCTPSLLFSAPSSPLEPPNPPRSQPSNAVSKEDYLRRQSPHVRRKRSVLAAVADEDRRTRNRTCVNVRHLSEPFPGDELV